MNDEAVEVLRKAFESHVTDISRVDAQCVITALNTAGYVIERDWRPIEEAPKDGTKVWAWSRDFYGLPHVARYASKFSEEHYCSSLSGWYAEGWDARAHPTHFRPLPKPPESDQ